MTRDESALNALSKKFGSDLQKSGTRDGAKVYKTVSGGTLAIEGRRC